MKISTSPFSGYVYSKLEYILSPKATKAKKKRIKEQLKADKKQRNFRKKRIRYRLIWLSLVTPIPAVPEPLISVNCSKWTQLSRMDPPVGYGIYNLAIDDATGTITGGWFDTQKL